MTDYQKEKVRDLISGLDPEEKEIAIDILASEIVSRVHEEIKNGRGKQ